MVDPSETNLKKTNYRGGRGVEIKPNIPPANPQPPEDMSWLRNASYENRPFVLTLLGDADASKNVQHEGEMDLAEQDYNNLNQGSSYIAQRLKALAKMDFTKIDIRDIYQFDHDVNEHISRQVASGNEKSASLYNDLNIGERIANARKLVEKRDKEIKQRAEADRIRQEQDKLYDPATYAPIEKPASPPSPQIMFPPDLFETTATEEDTYISKSLQGKFTPEDFGLPTDTTPRQLREKLSLDSMRNFVRLAKSDNLNPAVRQAERQAGNDGLRLITLLLGTAYESNQTGITNLTGFVDRMTEARVPAEVIDTVKLLFHGAALDYAAIASKDSPKDFAEIYEKIAGPNDDMDRQTINQRAAALHGKLDINHPEKNVPAYLPVARDLMNWINSPKVMFKLMETGTDPYKFLEYKFEQYTDEGFINTRVNSEEIGWFQELAIDPSISRGEIKLSIMLIKNLMIGNGFKDWWMTKQIFRSVENGEIKYKVTKLTTVEEKALDEKVSKLAESLEKTLGHPPTREELMNERTARGLLWVSKPKWFISNPFRNLYDFRAFVAGVKNRNADIYPGLIEEHPKDSPIAYYEKQLNYDGRLFTSDGGQILDLLYFGETTALNTSYDTTEDIDGIHYSMKWTGAPNPTVTEVMARDDKDCRVDPMKQQKFLGKWNNTLAVLTGITVVLPPKLSDVLVGKEEINLMEYAAVAGHPDDKANQARAVRQMQIMTARVMKLILAHYEVEGYPIDRFDLNHNIFLLQKKRRNMWKYKSYNEKGKNLYFELDEMAQRANSVAKDMRRDGAKRTGAIETVRKIVGLAILAK